MIRYYSRPEIKSSNNCEDASYNNVLTKRNHVIVSRKQKHPCATRCSWIGIFRTYLDNHYGWFGTSCIWPPTAYKRAQLETIDFQILLNSGQMFNRLCFFFGQAVFLSHTCKQFAVRNYFPQILHKTLTNYTHCLADAKKNITIRDHLWWYKKMDEKSREFWHVASATMRGILRNTVRSRRLKKKVLAKLACRWVMYDLNHTLLIGNFPRYRILLVVFKIFVSVWDKFFVCSFPGKFGI